MTFLATLFKRSFWKDIPCCSRIKTICAMLTFLHFTIVASSASFPLIDKEEAASGLVGYFEAMSVPKPIRVISGEELAEHQNQLRARLLTGIGLDPLPERIVLDVRQSEPVDHPWCTTYRIEYQLWPGVYTSALLYLPKEYQEQPAPAVLSPHGHWPNGHAYPDVQKRHVMLAKLGYVVLSPWQNHFEYLPLGISSQTLMVWTNMRGIDFLQSLPQVDPERIGVAGASGGGLSAQMVSALEDRLKAVTIVGLTCDYREIIFPHTARCGCNFWPNAMAFCDWPEMSSLAFPNPVQYLTMNDWSLHFQTDNFPSISALYNLNGLSGHVSCTYWPTGHVYDKEKREHTYWWMEQWLRGANNAPAEPDFIETVDPQTLLSLPVANPYNRGFDEIRVHYRNQHHYANRGLPSPDDMSAYRQEMLSILPDLLGLDNGIAPENEHMQHVDTIQESGVLMSRVLFPSEGKLQLPALIITPEDTSTAPWPVRLILRKEGASGAGDLTAAMSLAREGNMVILADIRFTGVYDLEGLAGIISPHLVKFDVAELIELPATKEEQRWHLLMAWERNSTIWGRSLVTMAAADIMSIINSVLSDTRADMESVHIETSGLAYVSLAATFAAILDQRIVSLDIDFGNHRYDEYSEGVWWGAPAGLPIIPNILRHGDIPQWISLLADRKVTMRNLDASQEEIAWLQEMFDASNFKMPADHFTYEQDFSMHGLGKCLWHWGAFRMDPPLGGFETGFVEDPLGNSIRIKVDNPSDTWGVGFTNAASPYGPGVRFPFSVAFSVDCDEWPDVGIFRVMPHLYVDGSEVYLGSSMQSAGFEVNYGVSRLYQEGGASQVVEKSGKLTLVFNMFDSGWQLHYSKDGVSWDKLGIGLLSYRDNQTFDATDQAVFYGKVWTLSGGAPMDVGFHDLTITASEDDFPDCALQSSTDPDEDTGTLTVHLAPSEAVSAGAKWSIDNGQTWNNSGVCISGLVEGEQTVAFSQIGGWEQPAERSVTIEAGQDVSIYADYVMKIETGSLTVSIRPADSIAAGAQWRVDGGPWLDSGHVLHNVATGDHMIQYKPDVTVTTGGGGCSHQSISVQWQPPPNQVISVLADQVTEVIATYTSTIKAW